MITKFIKYLLICTMFVILLLLGGIVSFSIYNEFFLSRFNQNYIAHGGGEINGHKYTNSVEAVKHSIECGIRYIEMDLALTSDGKLVCVHDWASFNEETTGIKSESAPSYAEFKKRRFINGGYRGMTLDDIDSIWTEHENLYLVTDKICDPIIIDKNLSKFKKRLLIECYTFETYRTLKQMDYYMPMISNCYNLKDWIKVVCNSLLEGNPCLPTFFCTDIAIFKNSQNKEYFPERPNCFGYALYSTPNRQIADSIFNLYSNVKFIYVDNIDSK